MDFTKVSEENKARGKEEVIEDTVSILKYYAIVIFGIGALLSWAYSKYISKNPKVTKQ